MLDAAAYRELHDQSIQAAHHLVERDGHLQGLLRLYGDHEHRMSRFEPGLSVEDITRIVMEGGVTPVLGTWVEHLELVRTAIRQENVTAATLIEEAWIGDLATVKPAMEAFGIPLAEHPLKDECVFVITLCPMLDIAHVDVFDIRRGRTGPGVSLEPRTVEDARTVLGGWLYDLLPH